MGKTAVIQTRVDYIIKRDAQNVLEQLNMSMSEAIALYLAQIALHKGIPFNINIPNELTAATLKESEEGKNLHNVASVDQLFKELDS